MWIGIFAVATFFFFCPPFQKLSGTKHLFPKSIVRTIFEQLEKPPKLNFGIISTRNCSGVLDSEINCPGISKPYCCTRTVCESLWSGQFQLVHKSLGWLFTAVGPILQQEPLLLTTLTRNAGRGCMWIPCRSPPKKNDAHKKLSRYF